MKAIALIRVSTLSQDLEQQTEVVMSAMVRDGYKKDDIILIEDKESAVKLSEEERQGINKMKECIDQDSSINCVYVFELSRLSRRPDVLYSVRDYLVERGIQLVVLKPTMRLLENGKISESASIMFAIFGALAEQEGYVRKERLARGKKRAKQSGKWVGGWLPTGYAHDEDNNIVLDPEKSETVKKIFRMCVEDDLSTIAIARELNQTGEMDWTSPEAGATAVRSILMNTAYIGVPPIDKDSGLAVYNQYPRIVSDEIFYKAKEVLSQRKFSPKTTHKHIYYCSGIIKDAKSGHKLSGKSHTASYAIHYRLYDGVVRMTVPLNDVDSLIWQLAKEYQRSHETSTSAQLKNEIKKKLASATKKVENSLAKVEALKQQEEKVQRRIIAGKVSEALGDEMVADILASIREEQSNISKWEADIDDYTAFVLKYAGRNVDTKDYDNINDDAERHKIIHDCIKLVEVDKEPKLEGHHRNNNIIQITVTFDNGEKKTYYLKTFVHKVFDENMVEIPFEYVERFSREKVREYSRLYKLKKKGLL